jgi:hypothetical protein
MLCLLRAWFWGKTSERTEDLFNNLNEVCNDMSVLICEVAQNTFYSPTYFGNSLDMMTEHSTLCLKFNICLTANL